MVRAILYAIIGIFAITFIRMVIGIITRGFADLMGEETKASRQQASRNPPPPTRGELKACHNCGTYVVASQALTAPDKSGTLYFCSQECRQKHLAA